MKVRKNLPDYDLSQLEMIGTGGEHIVFGLDDGKNVLKVNFHNLGNPSLDKIRRKNKSWLLLRKYFGNHIPFTQTTIKLVQGGEFFKQKVAQESKDLASTIEIGKTTSSEVTIQERIELGEDQIDLKINSFKNATPESVARLKNSFYYQEADKNYEHEILQDYPVFEKIFAKVDKNQKMRGQLADFTQRIINYAQETGEHMDLGGADNVIFFKNDKGVNYVLIDAIMLDSNNFAHHAERFQRWLDGDREGTNIQDICMHDIQYLRGLNALAWKTSVNYV